MGFCDLHCHWIANIDDGVRSPDDGIALLRALKAVGFDTVVATPHMRPNMFDNDKAALLAAYEAMQLHLEDPALPRTFLSSEHFFDDIVFARLVKGEGLPYPGVLRGGKRAVLFELPPNAFPPKLDRRCFDLVRAGLRPVLAHPERYQPVWKDDHCLDPLLDAGVALLLDVCALVGKYGRAAQQAAEKLLDDEAYEAACSDSHRPADADVTGEAIEVLRKRMGKEETIRLLDTAPHALLGTLPV